MWVSPLFFLSLSPRGYPDPFSSQCQLKSKLPHLMAHCLSWRQANVFQKWAPEIILPTNALKDMEIIYAAFAGSMITAGFGKVS
jgi:hypothetical protein